jgi:glycosyltransferase involved in cell wall biosynthesis
MSTGLACVVSDVPGNRALITHEVNGLVWGGDRAETLANLLCRLLDDPVLRERLGSAARQTIIENYSLDAVAEQYIAVYRQVIDS